MSDALSLFLRGLRDSLRLRKGVIDVLQSYELSKRTLQITLINGVLYLGSVWLFGASESWLPDILLIRLAMAAIQKAWFFIIYIMAMTLTTFWA